MISLNTIKQFYPPHFQQFERELLREYLQCQILQILFDSPLGRNFTFLGGTCLRLVHDNARFSEDLDFDNFGITELRVFIRKSRNSFCPRTQRTVAGPLHPVGHGSTGA